jgi:hypothetical protein
LEGRREKHKEREVVEEYEGQEGWKTDREEERCNGLGGGFDSGIVGKPMKEVAGRDDEEK